jgi:transcriptional regulator with XRE-family HTH domain
MLLFMTNRALGAAIERHLGERSQTWLAKQAKTTQPTISRIIRGVHIPAPDTIEAIAKALEIDAFYLLRLAGLPVATTKARDPTVEYLADRLDALPPPVRDEAVDALGALLDAIYKIAGLKAASPVIVSTITGDFPVLDDVEYLKAIIRQFHDADPEGYEEFVAALEDDERTLTEHDTSGEGDQGGQ